MDKSFDLGALLNKHRNKHKSKPEQFRTLAGGIKKRLETNLKCRRSSRLTIFDKIRDLPRRQSPPLVSDAQLKVERRRQQLEKWKEEKEQRKKEQAAQKKKPFVAGVAHAPLTYAPLPPFAPSTSGRVTRSQTAKHSLAKKVEPKPVKPTQSFAPKNATFRPPLMKNQIKVPTLAPVTKSKKENKGFIFNFISVLNAPKENEVNAKTRARTDKLISEPKDSAIMTRKHAKELKEDKVTKSRELKEYKVTKSRELKEDKVTKSRELTEDKVIKSRELTEDKVTKSRGAARQNQKLKKSMKNTVSGSSSSETEPTVADMPLVSKMDTPNRMPRKINNTSPVCVPRSESNSEERLRSPKSPGEIPAPSDGTSIIEATQLSPNISPCVTLSRGKSNARQEMKQKMKDGYLDEYMCAENLRLELNCHIARLTEMCNSWEKIREQTPLDENSQEEVLGAVGQARLLMSSKLQQFAGLVDQCAQADPDAPGRITAADLQGFWDMVFIQIENVNMRFSRLERRRENNWANVETTQPTRKTTIKNVKKAAKPATGTSKLREMIAAARKAKKGQEDQKTMDASVGLAVPSEENKVFEAGFFRVQSPVRSPAPATPNNKANLLKAVLSSEARKASNSKKPFAILRASIMSKTLEAEGIAPLPQTPLTPINLHATPGRSILKSANVKSGKKSIKTVLFDESDTESEDKQQTKSPRDNTECITSDSSITKELVVEEDKENKGSSRRKSKITRQEAVEERSPVMTRNRRKSTQDTPEVSKTRSRKTLQENIVAENVTPSVRRYSTRRKSAVHNAVM